MSGFSRRNKDLMAAFGLAVCILFFYHKLFISAESLYGGDFVLYFFPLKKFIREQLLTYGALPFWNMYQFSGTPLIANIQASMFYPLGFFYYLMSPERAYLSSTILHQVLGGLFMYRFMRTLSVSPSGCLVSALIFSMNGYFMGHLYAGHLSFVQNYIWIPLLFHFLAQFTRSRDLSYAVGGGLVLGVQILGGFPQIAFYTILAACAYLVFRVCASLHARLYRDALATALGGVLLILLGFCLAAIQLLPTLEFTALSTRAGGVSYEMATYDSLSPKDLLAFLVPDLFGNAVDETYWRSPAIWHFWETCGYVGILPLFLLFVRVESETRRRWKAFFAIMVAVSLFLALGKHNPAYLVAYHLPGFRSFRIPAQILFLYVFSVGAIAGIGIHRIQEGNWRYQKSSVAFLVFAGMILCLFKIGIGFYPFQFFFQLFLNFAEGPVNHADMEALYQRIAGSVDKSLILFLLSALFLLATHRWKRNSRLMILLASAVVIVDLWLFGSGFVKGWEFRSSPEKEQAAARVSASPAHGRVMATGPFFKPNDGLQYRFPSILGYDPLILKRYVHFFQASQEQPFNDHVVNLAHVHDAESKLLKLLHVRKMLMEDDIREVENPVPYAVVVSASITKSPEETLSFMKGEAFDPMETVVFEALVAAGRENKPAKAGRVSRASCTVEDYKSEKIILKVSTEQSGYLVLSEICYPGWRATVDGRKTDILCGNYLFRVIPLEAGDHEVRLDFISWPFRIGALLSLLSLTVSLGILVHQRKRR